MRKPLLTALILALAGCGQPPSLTIPLGAVPQGTQEAQTNQASRAPSQGSAQPGLQSGASASATLAPTATWTPDPLALSSQTLAGLSSYTCDEQVYGQKNGAAVGLDLGVSWMAPSNLRLDVESTNLSQTTGSVLVFDGGNQVTLKDPSLPFFMQTVTLSVDDPRLQDGFGNRFDQATWASVIANLTDARSKVSRIGTADVLGQNAIAYQVESSKLTADGLQSEQIGLDPADGKPVFIQQLDASGIASQIVFTHYAFDAVKNSSEFQL